MSYSGRVQPFEDLAVWQKAHRLTLDTYRATTDFPTTERYGLVSQMRNAVVSIEANIAEGCGRGTQADLGRFLQIARGSTSELECELLIARDLSFMSPEIYARLRTALIEVEKMLTAFRLKTRAVPS